MSNHDAARTVVGWPALPVEIQLQVLAFLDPSSLACFGATGRSNYQLTQDAALTECLSRSFYPLAAARHAKAIAKHEVKRSEIIESSYTTWYTCLLETHKLRTRIASRRCQKYSELSVGRELPSRYRRQFETRPAIYPHKAIYAFGRVVMFCSGMNVFIVVEIESQRSVEIDLPEPFSIRDICLEEDFVYVLSTRLSNQFIFKFDFNGKLINSFETHMDNLGRIVANKRHLLAYSGLTADRNYWFRYSVDCTSDSRLDKQIPISGFAIKGRMTVAIDDHYMYSLDDKTGELLVYDLDNQVLLPKRKFVESPDRWAIFTVNRHCYFAGSGLIALLDGPRHTLQRTPNMFMDDTYGGGEKKIVLKKLSDTTGWYGNIITDIGGWFSWMGDVEEAQMFGMFCVLPSEDATSDRLDCGRLRGPSEPIDQHETHNVVILGDNKWLIAALDDRLLIWQLQG